MSLGGLAFRDLEAAIDKAVEAGIIVICAAGNQFGVVVEPASYPNTIAVASVGTDGDPYFEGSSRGPEVTVSAPGVKVIRPDFDIDDHRRDHRRARSGYGDDLCDGSRGRRRRAVAGQARPRQPARGVRDAAAAASVRPRAGHHGHRMEGGPSGDRLGSRARQCEGGARCEGARRPGSADRQCGDTGRRVRTQVRHRHHGSLRRWGRRVPA